MRTTRVSTATVLVGVALVAGLPDPSPAQVPLPPNVLIILTDDQREDGTMHVLPETQGLFGSGGVRFAHGVATTPLCCPSRASIFSGKYAHNHGVTTNNNGWRFDSDESMQAELSEAGYRTALVGKFLNDWALEQAPPHFERFSVFNRGYYGATFNVDGTMTEVEDYSTDFIADKSIEYLDEFETTDPVPWMMEIAPYAPHIPAFPERQFATRPVGRLEYTPANTEYDLSDKPSYVRKQAATFEAAEERRAAQLRTLMSVDELVADVFRRLEILGEADNTIAFFLSDNGFHWFDHQLIGKRYPYNDSVEIPFYARWPARPDLFPPGAIDEQRVVANIDIAPTVYEAAGIVPDYQVDGRSMFSSDRRRILIEYLAADSVPKFRIMWWPRSAYIHYFVMDRREYYGRDDPWQLHNVYRDGKKGNEPPPRKRRAWEQWLWDAASCPERVPCP